MFFLRFPLSLAAALALVCPLLPYAVADDAGSSKASKSKAQVAEEKDIPTYNLLEAMNQGLVGVEAAVAATDA